jgi:hypothetical protein
MAITAAYEDSASIGTTEYSLPNDSTTLTPITVDGVYQAELYFDAMAAADQYQITVYEKVLSSGNQRIYYQAFITGVQSQAFVIPSLILMHGWDITVKKLAGTDRTVEWSIRQVA